MSYAWSPDEPAVDPADVDASFDEELGRYQRLVPEGGTLRDLATRLRAAAGEVSGLQPDALRAGADPVRAAPDVVREVDA